MASMKTHWFHLLAAVLAGTPPTSSADIVLSPTGPISTPAAARDAARMAPKPARIAIADGVYPVTGPLTLEPADSGVAWEAAPGAHPVFEGGRRIRGWKKVGAELWQADVADAKSGNWNFEQLWVNGRRATRARTPNRGYFNIVDAVGAGVFPDVKDGMNFHAFAVAPEHYDIIRAIPADQRDGALITVTHAWAVGQCRIGALDDATQAVLIKGRSRYPFVEFEPDQRYWMENFRAALDAPGEWFLDRTNGTLLYQPLPGENMTTAEVIAPVAEKFLTIKGAKDVAFKGIAFQHAQYLYPADGLHDTQAATTVDGVIEIADSSGIRFENCEVAHIGTHAVYFLNGCSESAVKHCRLHDLGAGGVRIGETARPSDERVNHHIVVDDTIIQHGGRLHPAACGVVLTHTRHCAVTHCDIGDLYYTGVSAGWNWGYGESVSRETLVENNHIHHLGWAYLSDMGGFYGLGTSPGTIVRGNHVHDVASHRYGGWGLYTDEGSTDVLMENNLVHDTWNAGFHQHYGYANRIRNNIFAFGHTAQVQRSRNEGRLCFIYERNIVLWNPPSPLLDGAEYNWALNEKAANGEPRDSAIFRNNLYWPTDGKIPEHLTASRLTWEEWRKMGRDAGSLFADPLFEDVGARDFRLKPGSPAAKVGFKPWDLTVAGVRRDGPEGKAWADLAAKGHDYPSWAKEAVPWPAPVYKVERQGFEGTPVGVVGIRNAAYRRPPGAPDLGESVAVSEEAASPLPAPGVSTSRRSLKFQDAPGLSKNYLPMLDIMTKWDAGTVHAGFDAMAQPGADWFFELRTGTTGEYGAGPMVSWKNGVLFATVGDRVKLADIPAGEWFRLGIVAGTGSGKYTVTLTRQNGAKQEFRDIACKPEWDKAGYLLFSSLGTTRTAFFIDNVTLTLDPL